MYFRNSALGVSSAYMRPPTLGTTAAAPVPTSTQIMPAPTVPSEKLIEHHLSVQSIIRSYQVRQIKFSFFNSSIMNSVCVFSSLQSLSIPKIYYFSQPYSSIN